MNYVLMAEILKVLKIFLPYKLSNKSLIKASSHYGGNTKINFSFKILEYSFSYINIFNKLFYQLLRQSCPNNQRKLLQNTDQQSIQLRSQKYFWNFRKNKNSDSGKRVPKLILVQNPLSWLMIKIDFSVLRSIWDPHFQEKEFKYGTKQAISRVTQVISDGNYADLNGLLTKPARSSLLRELDRNWSNRQRSLLALKNNDIQVTAPRRVYFIRIADKKFCDVDMVFLALKWAPLNSVEALIFTEIFARFHREYTPHCIPEWTIAYFKVTRFQVLRN